jgi:hypothetical protein
LRRGAAFVAAYSWQWPNSTMPLISGYKSGWLQSLIQDLRMAFRPRDASLSEADGMPGWWRGEPINKNHAIMTPFRLKCRHTLDIELTAELRSRLSARFNH